MTLEKILATHGPDNTPELASPASDSPSVLKAPTVPIYASDLTPRELEVLRLVAQGRTDAQIAEQLVISPRTVNAHITSIYRKIQVSSRSAATRYAIDHQLE